MTQITIPAQVVNGHLQHEKSLAELEGQHVIATLIVVPKDAGQKWREKIESMNTLQDDWDSYRAPAPAANSINQAIVFLDEVAKSANDLSRLAPSVVGGVGFTFKHGERKVYVEFRNTGSVLALFSDGAGEPIVDKIEPTCDEYTNVLLRIKKYLHE